MSTRQQFFLEAGCRPDFLAAGVAGFDQLMHGDAGEVLSRAEGGREVRRLTVCTPRGPEEYYLKRLGREPLTMALRMALFGQRPHSGPLRELALIRRLQQAGFAAMEPVAWGEVRRGFLPVSGFLAVRAVAGPDAANLFARLPSLQRRQLMRAVGALVGRLHAAGFYHPVRLKDLIAAEGHEHPWSQLVLIDRETSKPWPSRFSVRRCLASLARATRRTLRDGHRLGPGSVSGFLRGYALGVSGRWRCEPVGLAKDLFKVIRKELSASH